MRESKKKRKEGNERSADGNEGKNGGEFGRNNGDNASDACQLLNAFCRDSMLFSTRILSLIFITQPARSVTCITFIV